MCLTRLVIYVTLTIIRGRTRRFGPLTGRYDVMAELQPAPPETPETSLSKGRMGILGIVFFVVAAAAPLVGMTGAVQPDIGAFRKYQNGKKKMVAV